MFNSLNSNLYLFIIIIFVCQYAKAGDIVDFQYAEYSQAAIGSKRPYDYLSILPSNLDLKTFQFPQACNFIQNFKKHNYKCETQIAKREGLDDYLEGLKQKFLKFMTLSQKITTSQSKVEHLNGLINRTKPQPPLKVDIQILKKYQKQINEISQNATQKSTQLENIIANMSQQKGSSQRLQRQYKLETIKNKLKYLNQLKKTVQDKIQAAGDDIEYQNYFDNLTKQYDNQTAIIDNISELIVQKDKLVKLKLQASNLKSSIQALKLYIEDLQSCQKEQQNFRTGFKNHDKIKQLIAELKIMKEKQTGNNIYCQGVVKKLTTQIKHALKMYEIIFSCSSDINQKNRTLLEKRKQLEEVQNKIKEYQKNQPIEDLIDLHEKQKILISSLYQDMKNWKIKDYTHNPKQIQALIKKTQMELVQAQKLVDNLKPEKPQPNNVSQQILSLIKEIKILKLNYCKLYQEYDNFANKLWNQAYIYQSESELLKKLKSLYNEQWKRLTTYHKQFYKVKRQINAQI